VAQGENMLRYVGETPFANYTWRLLNTNFYLARYQPGAACLDQRPAFCVFTWRGGEKWNIPSGMCDISAKVAMQIFARLTSRAVDKGGAGSAPKVHPSK
jgi:hypothetical protein